MVSAKSWQSSVELGWKKLGPVPRREFLRSILPAAKAGVSYWDGVGDIAQLSRKSFQLLPPGLCLDLEAAWDIRAGVFSVDMLRETIKAAANAVIAC